MVIDRDREHLLGVVLTNHVLIERALDLRRLEHTKRRSTIRHRRRQLTVDDRFANVYA